MPESWATRRLRWAVNLFYAFAAGGARVTYIGGDWREVRVEVPLNWRTRNYVGTIFGGAMYAAVDPIYMLMLIHCLGLEYIVWDKTATIRFRKPGRSTLRAEFRLEDAELDAIRRETAEKTSIDRVYRVELIDTEGAVCAEVEKTLYIRKKDAGRT